MIPPIVLFISHTKNMSVSHMKLWSEKENENYVQQPMVLLALDKLFNSCFCPRFIQLKIALIIVIIKMLAGYFERHS